MFSRPPACRRTRRASDVASHCIVYRWKIKDGRNLRVHTRAQAHTYITQFYWIWAKWSIQGPQSYICADVLPLQDPQCTCLSRPGEYYVQEKVYACRFNIMPLCILCNTGALQSFRSRGRGSVLNWIIKKRPLKNRRSTVREVYGHGRHYSRKRTFLTIIIIMEIYNNLNFVRIV